MPDLSAAPALDAIDTRFIAQWPALPALLVLLATCGIIVVVDWRARIIPDGCNALVAVLGVGLAAGDGTLAAWSAAEQGCTAFALIWLARALYNAIRSVQGLGLGDVKFLAAATVWVGLGGLPPLILIASAAALTFVGLQWWRGTTVTARHAIPFGPFLVAGFAGVVASALI